MKKLLIVLCGAVLLGTLWAIAFADTQGGEKEFLAELTKAVPKDHIMTVDDLYKKWQEVQAGASKALIVDIRTHDEFNAGHIKGANNVDSGHAYTVPKLWSDPSTEIWVFCRTQHRASYFTSLLYKYGYKNVYLVNGGVQAWAEKGYPMVSEYLGEIKVTKYDKKVKEEYLFREGH